MNKENNNIVWIDLFCGAGGTSTGIHLAGSEVAACVNHDTNAIESHKENHPEAIHLIEDIRDMKVVLYLAKVVAKIRADRPGVLIALWASLECTNFSNAKGGKPRDADSRSLAEFMPLYLKHLKPDYFCIENVREFMSWGELDEKGKPKSRDKGIYYLRWIKTICSFGFKHDAKILNAANYGAYTSRQRLFIIFATNEMPISWPEQTHAKGGSNNGLFSLPKWKAVREVLDLHDEGISIFAPRKKPYSEKTLARVLAGLNKFVAKGESKFIKKYYSGRPAGKVISCEGPAGTVTTVDGQAVVQCTAFIAQYNSGSDQSRCKSIDEPINTIPTANRFATVAAEHLHTYYGKSSYRSFDEPAQTVTTKDRINRVSAHFIMNQYSNGGFVSSVENPSGTITTTPKQNLVEAEPFILDTQFNNVGSDLDKPAKTVTASRHYPYLINANSSTAPAVPTDNPAPAITSRTHLIVNPGWFGNVISADEPCLTIVARQDKSPLYYLVAQHGHFGWAIYDNDSPMMIEIKAFCAAHNICDVKMRMLLIHELLQIQGFPKNYKLKGTKTEQKKYIGNSVEVNQAKAIISAIASAVKPLSVKRVVNQ